MTRRTVQPLPGLEGLIDQALVSGDGALRDALVGHSGLPGARLNLELVAAFAQAVGDVVQRAEPPVERLEELLDGWAALSAEQAPGDQPDVVLVCAAVRAYGEVGAVRPDWWDDEIGKLRLAATDSRWRVREVVTQALQRLLTANWDRTTAVLLQWASDDDPLVVRAATASVAEPPLFRDPKAAASALSVQRQAVARYRAYDAEQRRSPHAKTLRQALGFTVSVAVAASGDFTLLDEMATSDDADLRWITRQSLKKARLRQWPDQLARLQQALDPT